MRFLAFRQNGKSGLAVEKGGEFFGEFAGDPNHPGSLTELVAKGGNALTKAGEALARGKPINLAQIEFEPPLPKPGKIICLGLNYADHAAEGGFEPPPYPTVFARYATSLIGHNASLVRPRVSDQFDYEGEMVAIIGRGGRHISKASALSHVVGYSVFNDGSVRDYQMKTPQWTVGKNFDGTGAFGPYFVTADEVPPGGSDLKIETRLNGQVVQSSNTSKMIFDTATTIALLSEAFTLEAGDVLVMGTPSGIGAARKPPLFMKAGDVCEVEIQNLGVLSNKVVDETAGQAAAASA